MTIDLRAETRLDLKIRGTIGIEPRVQTEELRQLEGTERPDQDQRPGHGRVTNAEGRDTSWWSAPVKTGTGRDA